MLRLIVVIFVGLTPFATQSMPFFICLLLLQGLSIMVHFTWLYETVFFNLLAMIREIQLFYTIAHLIAIHAFESSTIAHWIGKFIPFMWVFTAFLCLFALINIANIITRIATWGWKYFQSKKTKTEPKKKPYLEDNFT